MKRFLIALLLAGLPGAAPAADFADLQRLDARQIVGAGAPAVVKWAVSYQLDGMLNIREGRIILNTPDGRLFTLRMDPAQARKYDGSVVAVEGKVMQADDRDVLKVENIAPYTPPVTQQALSYDPMQRRVSVLSDQDAAMRVQNVRWHKAKPGEFDWATAAVKPGAIKDIYLIKQPFPPELLAAHSLLLFTFERGGLTDADGNEAYGLVLSIEAYLKVGQPYNPLTGMKNSYNIIWTLSTWEDYARRSVQVMNKRLIPYKLAGFSAQQNSWLVRETLRQAGVNRDGEFYHTVTNNCTNNLLILMNRALPESRRIPMWDIPYSVYNLEATMPVFVPGYLQGKGLLGPELPEVTLANLNLPLP
jgi:hypothetical protein